ncbi:alpha/beta fold hydrolase [Pedobacter sp. L105]|uniref:alpha/beta fold hydrolase n=1 Tax=Pedobacter sp. L105 TaxID=1641871 RepID=UPI00131C4AD5|nr:alpha/beta hydrolase [Pedobacter sp. L105]
MTTSKEVNSIKENSPEGLISGFERRKIMGAGTEIDVLVGGSGPPLLLLHGYPQTRLCWKNVALELLDSYTLVIPDLRGYGRSGKPEPGENHINYSKRVMASDQVMIMKELGFETFYAAGHDRGGRVAYRLALDYPDLVLKLAVLDIVPTLDAWEGINASKGMNMWHWFFLAQDKEIAEHFINKDPEFFIRWTLSSQAAENFEFDQDCLDDYIQCALNPAVIKGMCEDYRASWTLDKDIDQHDFGKVKIACPFLVLWGEKGNLAGADPIAVWNKWGGNVQGKEVPGGHLVPEEAVAETISELRKFF